MKFTLEGKEYEFRGEYTYPVEGTRFLNDRGQVELATIDLPRQRAIVHPVEPELTKQQILQAKLENLRLRLEDVAKAMKELEV